MNRQDVKPETIKKLIKTRGYTFGLVCRLLGYSRPTLETYMRKRPFVIYYAIKGLPEMTHIHDQRQAIIRE